MAKHMHTHGVPHIQVVGLICSTPFILKNTILDLTSQNLFSVATFIENNIHGLSLKG